MPLENQHQIRKMLLPHPKYQTRVNYQIKKSIGTLCLAYQTQHQTTCTCQISLNKVRMSLSLQKHSVYALRGRTQTSLVDFINWNWLDSSNKANNRRHSTMKVFLQ